MIKNKGVNANQIVMLPRKIISTPIAAAGILFLYFWLASVAFAQGSAPTSSGDIFYLAGVLSFLGLATAAVIGALKKTALNEYRLLAEVRKEKVMELELENEKLKTRNKELEAENESLEKKNLRLQDERIHESLGSR